MLKKSKGFTLVELLAVIIILAIIALISTPIILNIIEGARKDAAKASAMGYERAVNLKIMDGELTGKPIEDNEYDIKDLEVTVSGKAPDEGKVKVEGKEVVEYTLRFGEYTVTKTKDGSITVTKGKVEMITFTIEGQEFTVAKGTLLKDVQGLSDLKIKEGFVFKNFKIEDGIIDENSYLINESVEITIEWEEEIKKAQDLITKLVPNENNEKTSGNGTIENLGKYGIRYRGSNPDNYVEFNGELWRIIGIVDGYVKIVSESLKNSSGEILFLVWDNTIMDYETLEGTYGENEWTEASLMKLLNPGYTGTGGSLYWNRESGQCYGDLSGGGDFIANKTMECNFTKTGLKLDAQNMIESVIWKLGGSDTEDITKEEMYEKERGVETYSGRQKEWTGKVGLIYPSDYGFASPKECTEMLYSYAVPECTNNWLAENNSFLPYFTLTPLSSSSSQVFEIDTRSGSGFVSHEWLDYAVSKTHSTRPTVHLKQDVKIIDGDGSQSHPYKLS